jgi:hypothetical protein
VVLLFGSVPGRASGRTPDWPATDAKTDAAAVPDTTG